MNNRPQYTQVFREAEQITKLRRWFISKVSRSYGITLAVQAGVLFDESLTMSYVGYRQGVPAVSGINLANLFRRLAEVTGGFDLHLSNETWEAWKTDSQTAFDVGTTGASTFDAVDIKRTACRALQVIYNELRIGFAMTHLALWVNDRDNIETVKNLALAYSREHTNKEFKGHVQRIANISRDSAIVMLMSVDGLNYAQASTFVNMVRMINSSVR
ncbi:hypothetical protein vBAbaMD22_98 [Acinetobacter phage vB_AbaM_D22]|nr:hypothetical protein vBAbaMD22_98 [Acinetobacter phage vB_AbaM_D22]